MDDALFLSMQSHVTSLGNNSSGDYVGHNAQMEDSTATVL
jgi:hypothetical protein